MSPRHPPYHGSVTLERSDHPGILFDVGEHITAEASDRGYVYIRANGRLLAYYRRQFANEEALAEFLSDWFCDQINARLQRDALERLYNGPAPMSLGKRLFRATLAWSRDL